MLDGAHNPDAVAALVESLPAVLGGRPLGLVLGVLEDKDAAGMLGLLLPLCERAWFTAPPSARALSPAALQSLARQLGFEAAASEAVPWRALAEARGWARERGAAVLATGSVYLVGDLLARLQDGTGAGVNGPRAAAAEHGAMNDEGPSVLTMIGAVALIVALVILVFFAAGYGFGRLFL